MNIKNLLLLLKQAAFANLLIMLLCVVRMTKSYAQPGALNGVFSRGLY